MKFKNPFRTKRIIFCGTQFEYLVIIPFLRKIRFVKRKINLRGRKVKLIVMDEAAYIPEELWKKGGEK